MNNNAENLKKLLEIPAEATVTGGRFASWTAPNGAKVGALDLFTLGRCHLDILQERWARAWAQVDLNNAAERN
jgi:hypothetical protein